MSTTALVPVPEYAYGEVGCYYALSPDRVGLEAQLDKSPLHLGTGLLVPGQETTLDDFYAGPVLFVGHLQCPNSTLREMLFYQGECQRSNPLFEPLRHCWEVFWWVDEARFFQSGGPGFGRDFKYRLGTWDWQRGPGTKLGGRATWQKGAKADG